MIVIKTTKNDQTKYKYFYSASADLRNKIQNRTNRIKTYDIIIKLNIKHILLSLTLFSEVMSLNRGFYHIHHSLSRQVDSKLLKFSIPQLIPLSSKSEFIIKFLNS